MAKQKKSKKEQIEKFYGLKYDIAFKKLFVENNHLLKQFIESFESVTEKRLSVSATAFYFSLSCFRNFLVCFFFEFPSGFSALFCLIFAPALTMVIRPASVFSCKFVFASKLFRLIAFLHDGYLAFSQSFSSNLVVSQPSFFNAEIISFAETLPHLGSFVKLS